MAFQISTLFAALLSFLTIALAYNVTVIRRRRKISLLDGGSRELARAMRAHGNLAEYAPLFLLLLVLAESAQAPSGLLYGLGGLFFMARVLHAHSILRRVRSTRFVSTAASMAAILILASYLCFRALS